MWKSFLDLEGLPASFSLDHSSLGCEDTLSPSMFQRPLWGKGNWETCNKCNSPVCPSELGKKISICRHVKIFTGILHDALIYEPSCGSCFFFSYFTVILLCKILPLISLESCAEWSIASLSCDEMEIVILAPMTPEENGKLHLCNHHCTDHIRGTELLPF